MGCYYDVVCIESAEDYFERNKEIISCSEVERIANECFADEHPKFKVGDRHLKRFKKVYITQVILPYIEEKLKENSEKRRTLTEILSEFDISSDWKPNLTNYLHNYIKKRDNDLIMVSSVVGMRLMLYQYNPECAEAMRNGRSEGKWLCYEDMCNSPNCRKVKTQPVI